MCLIGLLTAAPLLPAAVHLSRRRVSVRHLSGVVQRKRLHVNNLIAEPGTMEIDFGYLYSWTTEAITLPSSLRVTPEGDSLWWGRTEYGVAFDSISSAVNTGLRSTQFSDRLSFTATSVLFDSEHFDIAVAPQITAMLRNDSGARWGATVIGRFDDGRNSFGVTGGWSGATAPSDTNPAGAWEFGAGFGRALRRQGPLHRITPHANAVLDRATGIGRSTSLFGGFEYQVNDRFSVDASGQRFSLTGAGPDRQFLLSVTMNTGRLRRRR